jgi:hypothetical protein
MASTHRPKQLTFITALVLIFGVAMFVYWGLCGKSQNMA